ncbi:Vacuolar protein sorting-associated protein 20 [Nakaseomyces bracarensis]|uniref:Vacuolar protein sorting-associated protein 20 n=1 Tax=Nakaseomyces bracarensis TaxID=273131 RepID=A0ABR4NN47_9SACH
MGQKASKVHITETDRAILQIKRSKDEIHRYTKRTNNLIDTERSRLKLLIKENPKTYKKDVRVRLLLKKIHYQEHLLQQASDQLINLENMVSTLEFKMVESQFMEGLKNGNDLLKKLNAEFKDVDKVIDDVHEQIAYQNEIDEALSNSVVGTSNFEDEIDKELESLDKEINPSPELPSTNGLPSLKDKEGEVADEAHKEKEQNRVEEPLLAS